MRAKRIKLAIIISVFLIAFALVFFLFGILTPSSRFDEMKGFSKIFAASPEFSFEDGSFVTSFGSFSFSVNFGFSKPFISLLSDGPVIHVNIFIVAALFFAMMVSCAISEVSSATSAVFAVLVGVALGRIIPILRQGIADGTPKWDVAAGCFWFISFLLALLIVNGIVGIGGKIFSAIIITDGMRIFVTLLMSTLLANAVSFVLCLFAYLTVGLGWCGGVMLWFVVSLILVIFLEIMDIISF